MELISLELPDAVLAAGCARVTAAELGLERAPVTPEGVVVHDKWTGSYFAGTISASEGGPPAYDLQIGMRLPETMALGRVTGFPTPAVAVETRPVAEVAVELRTGLAWPAPTGHHSADVEPSASASRSYGGERGYRPGAHRPRPG